MKRPRCTATTLLPLSARHRIGLCAVAIGLVFSTGTQAAGDDRDGRSVYDYYCYQCHGYSGRADTLASSMLEPPPRDFTRSSPDVLTRERMLDAVSQGRPGTGMVSFSAVLTATEREAVVDYVRDTLLGTHDADKRYHTPENGWPDMQRYRDAWPFATRDIPLSTPAAMLDEATRRGRRLYVESCISCHEAVDDSDDSPVFRLRSVSIPYMPYEEEDVAPDSVFNLHRRQVTLPGGASVSLQRGASLYAEHCASCHAEDGTGRNWVGSFLLPNPPNLTVSSDRDPRRASQQRLRGLVLDGIVGTAMPAFRHVLDGEQIDDVVTYLHYMANPNDQGIWSRDVDTVEASTTSTPVRDATPPPVWQVHRAD